MLIFLLISFFTFSIYILGVSPSVYGGDSGDIILAAYFGGVAHPPGYPLNTMIGWIFTHLPVGISVAYKANLMMAIVQSLVVGVVFLTLYKLTKNIFASLSAVFILAFTPLFWLYAHVAEVFQLNLLLVSISCYFLILWRQSFSKKRGEIKFLYLAFLFWGLAVFHHQTSVLLAPAYFFLIYKTDKKIFGKLKSLLKLFGFFLLGFTPYIYVPFAALRKTPINWTDASNLDHFARLVTRADYGSFIASKSFVGARAGERVWQVLSYFGFVKSDFTLFGILLMILGAVYLIKREKVLFWFLFLAAFFSGPFFLAYASFALSGSFLFGIWERFLLLSYFFLAIFLAFGVVAVFEFIVDKFLKKIRLSFIKREVVFLIFGLSFLAFPLTLLLVNYPKTDLSGFKLGDWLGHDALVSSEPGSMLFLFDDTLVFNTQYVFYTSSDFGDRKVIAGGLLRHLDYRQQLMREYPDLTFPDNFAEFTDAESAYFMTELIKSNLGKLAIYSLGFQPPIKKGYVWLPVGLLNKLEKDDVDSETVLNLNTKAYSQFNLKDFGANFGYTHFIPEHIKELYYFSLVGVGNEMLARGFVRESQAYFRNASLLLSELLSDKTGALIGSGDAYMKLSDCEGAKSAYIQAYVVNSHSIDVLQSLVRFSQDCDKNAVKVWQDKLDSEKRKGESKFR
ncbi:hypothetical protein A3B51_00305 [Candidatus Curtissbacteria bacterium RIFCSPLOWO2_01_FULL_41_18]|uniref:DUF2723 domain-containing protein n=1 Tax=Candidatus Curtissbacteria bacterium RIFCSPLOWO2_01_FULL_41_18 TaxID=1797727 RepID=A0A1F5HKI8_9BACT|nr:MAG: hypothetical protein A3B51_00305 [Candidatus Curtissbacteria bacterium RIFCSPLOWO2_01_FULL_41_18]